jgi:GntR family transcriptional regulator, arabinose operon transcriptional repressor
MPEQKDFKYRQISDHVYQGILGGRYRPGARIPTEMELATHFDASRMTVSRALRDLVSQGLLLRRHGAGTFVRGVEARTVGSVGLLLPDFPWVHDGVFHTLALEVTRQAQAAGYTLLLRDPAQGGIEALVQDPEGVCELYIRQEAACVIFAPAELPTEDMSVNVRLAETLERANIPLVLVDRDICEFPARSHHDLVGVDNVGASYVLAQHLLGLGYRRIHYVAMSTVAATVSARIMGYKMALLEQGIMPEADWVHRGDPQALEFVRDLVEHAAAEAFMCSNDHVAAMLMRHLAALGVRVPKDVAIVGFDDAPFASVLAPPLTTVRQPGTELGAAAARVMLERLAHPDSSPREVRLSCELIIRESCGAQTSPPPAQLPDRRKVKRRA